MPVAEIAGHHERSLWDWSIKPSKVISVKTRRLVCVLLRRTQILHRNMNLKKCCLHLLLSGECDAFSIPPARVTLTAKVRQPALSLPPSPPPALQCLFYLNFENISVQFMSR